MRILHLVETYSVHTERIARHQVSVGHEVRVITFRDSVGDGRATVLPRPERTMQLPYAHHWIGMRRFLSIVRDFRPTLVHGHYLSTAALYLLSCRPTPVIGSAIGSDILVDPESAHARLILKASRRWINGFTSVAPHVTARMVQFGIDAGRIATFPWGVDSGQFYPPRALSESMQIVSTRSLEPVYDLETLIRAFAELPPTFRNWRLAIYGEGSSRSVLEKLVTTLYLEDRVSFLGHRGSEEIAEALRHSAIYVSTALSDGTSASLLEAMASGSFPIVTDIDANRFWVRDGVDGLRFQKQDVRGLSYALEHAITHPELRESASQSNSERVRKDASWDLSMRLLEETYSRVIS